MTAALEIRPEEHAALVDGRPLSLTMRELQLLYTEVWGGHPRPDDRSVDVYVSRLRSKLGEALPLLAGRLSARCPARRLYIFFTSSTHASNKVQEGRCEPAVGFDRKGRLRSIRPTNKGRLMSSFRWLAVFASAALLVFGVAACGDSEDSSSTSGGSSGGGDLSGEVAGAGATSQEAAQEAWIANFESENSGVTLSYDPVGSGGGREQFIAGGVAYAGSDAAVSEEEGETKAAIKRCGPGELIEVPAYVSPIAIIYNLPEVEGLKLSPETLAKIFNQEITSWNDKAIAVDNPGVELPDTRISPVNRSDESGTTENFTEYLSEVVPSVWTHEVSGDWPVKGGEAASGTSGVVEAVTAGEGAIGYADASQAGENEIAQIEVGKEFAEPTPEAAAAILEESPEDKELKGGQYTFPFALDRKTEAAGTYPIVLVSYLLACTEYKSASEAEVVKGFLSYAISPEGQEAAAENAGSAPLSSALTSKITPAVEAIEAG